MQKAKSRKRQKRPLLEFFLAAIAIFSFWNLTFIYRAIENEPEGRSSSHQQSLLLGGSDISPSDSIKHLDEAKVITVSDPTRNQQHTQKTREIFGPVEYERKKKSAMAAFHNVSTVAYPHGPFGGFRNQYMTLTGLMLMIHAHNHSQVIVETIKWKDLYGTNQRLRHDLFFDVKHWNSFYPTLPRFVEYDAALHPDITILGKKETPSLRWNVEDPFKATKPFAVGDTGLQAQNQYKQYVKKVGMGLQDRDPIDLNMLKSAFRPHPALQQIIDEFTDGLPSGYLALHARIEPDMQKHKVCVDSKVTNFTHILEALEEKFPVPPASKVLLILNRDILEKEVQNDRVSNPLAEYNLMILNRVVERGMWGGRVEAIEAGVGLAKQAKHPVYSKYFSLSGSIIDFFLAAQADMFVGTEISSFSVDVEITRFYRGYNKNYHYGPDGIKLTTPSGAKYPPRFKC